MEFLAAWIAWCAIHPILTFIIYQLSGLAGMVSHFLKLEVKGQTADDIRNYFQSHFKDTVTAVIATLFVAGLAFIMGQGLMAAFLAGYAFDSVFNKGN
jgi:hypothetical protein